MGDLCSVNLGRSWQLIAGGVIPTSFNNMSVDQPGGVVHNPFNYRDASASLIGEGWQNLARFLIYVVALVLFGRPLAEVSLSSLSQPGLDRR